MDFNQLVQFIKMDGCSVRIYNNKRIMSVAQCTGTFDISKAGNPIISVATKGQRRIDLIRILLHEYAHYRQWKDGFMGKAELISKGWDTLDKWLKGKQYTNNQLYMARNCVVLIEYDAEIRTVQLSRNLGIDLGDNEDFLDNAHSYISHLKNVFRTRNWSRYKQLDLCNIKLTPEQILAPLTKEEIVKLGT